MTIDRAEKLAQESDSELERTLRGRPVVAADAMGELARLLSAFDERRRSSELLALRESTRAKERS